MRVIGALTAEHRQYSLDWIKRQKSAVGFWSGHDWSMSTSSTTRINGRWYNQGMLHVKANNLLFLLFLYVPVSATGLQAPPSRPGTRQINHSTCHNAEHVFVHNSLKCLLNCYKWRKILTTISKVIVTELSTRNMKIQRSRQDEIRQKEGGNSG